MNKPRLDSEPARTAEPYALDEIAKLRVRSDRVPFRFLREGDEKAGTLRVRLLEILQRARRVTQSYVNRGDEVGIDEGLGT
jgi:hypothetical protein